MEPAAERMLAIIGATSEGKKELVGFQVGVRESAQSWRELLIDIQARGLARRPVRHTPSRPLIKVAAWGAERAARITVALPTTFAHQRAIASLATALATRPP